MDTEGFNMVDDHIPGGHVNEYLHQFATRFNLEKHLQFNCNVEAAVDNGETGWTLTVEQTVKGSATPYTIEASRLVLATGLTSEPSMPTLDGKDAFNAPIYHSSELAKAEKGLGHFQKVVLLGGAKYSWDLAYAYALAGVQVEWVIRESGHGPCWMMPNRLTPLKIIPELLLQTRLITWLSPSMFDDGFSWIRNFFHQHWFGRKIVDNFFAKMQHSGEEANGYDNHSETAKLKPWDDIFFIGTNRGLLNYEGDFFELVRDGKIKVHIADIQHLSKHTVHLSNGEAIDADVLICGTGWKDTPQLNFVTEKEILLPGHKSLSTQVHIPRADAEIFHSSPKLLDQPTPRHSKPTTGDKKKITPEPYRFYRFMVPPAFVQSRTLAFAGSYRSPATTITAQTQALWITAFLDDQIPALQSHDEATEERVLYETVLHTQFGKWRYSRGYGARFPEMWFECLPYVDLLLKDIGIKNQRKSSWWAECFAPYMPADYKGIVDEYLSLKRKRS